MNERYPASAGKAALAALLLAGTTSAHAATVVFYDFDGASGFTTAVDTLGTDILGATNFTSFAGTIDSRAGVTGQALRLAGWDANQFLEFKFTIDPTKKLALTGVQFAERFGGAGGGAGGGGGAPQTFSGWNLLVNGVERAGAGLSTLGSGEVFESANQTLDVADLTGEVTIRLTADGPFVAGSWFIDNFTLTGDIAPIPVPAAVWLFGSAVAGLAAWRRRTI